MICFEKVGKFEVRLNKMAVEEKENQAESEIAEENSEIAEENAECSHELREHFWSVVSFDECEANGLTYTEAEEKLAELAAQKVSGLCIITDEAAARIAGKK